MKHVICSFYERYRQYHDMNRSFLEWLGGVGSVAFPFFYLLKFTGAIPPRYDDFELRLVATGLCFFLGLRRWWPAPMKKFYVAYSYLVVCYCLCFMFSFTAIKNEGEVFSIVNMMVGAFLTILLADWRNAITMLLLGYGLSLITSQVLEPGSRAAMNFLIWTPAYLLVVVAGSLSYFAQKQAEVRRMRQIYSGLAGSIAHEMRAPMQKIHSVFEALERDILHVGQPPAPGALTPEQMMAMAQLVKEGRNAIKLGLQSINVTLQHLKPQAFDTSTFTCLSAAECVRRAVNEFGYEDQTQRERVRVEEGVDFQIKGDDTILVMVLFNLIRNAVYYLPAYPRAAVTVKVDRQCITVTDTGPGIAPERLARLFEDFQTSGKADGTGLGLAFCKRAMKAFGGDITCASVLREYTQFTLAFPEVPQAEVRLSDEDAIRRAGELLRGCRVLVVDDEETQRRATMARLQCLGNTHGIYEASDGADAIQRMRAAAEVPYDLIVMDINMPVLDGYAATRQIRLGAAPGHGRVPVLAHSANPMAEALSRTRAAGMDGFLSKPCRLPDMARAIVRVLKDRPSAHDRLKGPAPFAGHTVLLADDSSVNRAVVKGYLETLGLEVIEAQQGLDVLRILKAGTRPDVIVMDIEMPGLDGLETTRRLRAMADGPHALPVIALTGHSSPEDVAAVQAAGMNGFLSKPVSVPDLTRALSTWLNPATTGGSRRVLAPWQSVELVVTADEARWLDGPRMQELQKMAMFKDLVPRALADIRRFIAALERAVVDQDLHGAHQALHSLVGMSGEVGAHALLEAARECSQMVRNQAWPTDADWLRRLQVLITDAERALLAVHARWNPP